jgi:hypothetical protein
MRQGQQNKRMRGRNRKGPNPLTRSYESNGGDVKIRGTALHIAEKYVQLARDAHSSGDRVAAENYFQHAEHYYRILAAAQAQMPQPQPIIRNDDESMDDEEGGDFRVNGAPGGERQQLPPGQGPQPAFGFTEAQSYVNGAADGDDDGGDAMAGQGPEQGGQPPNQQQNRGGHGGHFRRRRQFRDRYGERGERSERSEGGNRPETAAPEQGSDD